MRREKKVKVVADLEKVNATVFALHLNNALGAQGVLAASGEEAQLIAVVGGDGTMIRTIHKYGLSRSYLGINFGKKGFFMNDGDVRLAADNILNGRLETHKFPLLEIESENGWSGWAINDVYFNRITGQAAEINVKVSGTEIAERISGDGIVVCTALGSGGYYVPAGGSILHPKLPVIGFAPIICNTPIQLIPMVFPLGSEVEVALLSPQDEVRGFYDGLDLPLFEKIKVRIGKKQVKLVFWEGEDFTARLIRKIIGSQEVKNANN